MSDNSLDSLTFYFQQMMLQNQKREFNTQMTPVFDGMPARQALEVQDREEIYQRQIQIRSQYAFYQQSGSVNNTSIDSISQKNICLKPLKELKKIYLKDCLTNTVMKDCVVYVKQFTDAAQVIAANIGVEDEMGDFITLTFYNTFKVGTSLKVLDSNFPKGQSLAIKNPYLKHTSSGTFVLRNDNPGNLEKILGPPLKSIQPISEKDKNILNQCMNLKEQGNKCFESSQYQEALDVYQKALQMLQQQSQLQSQKEIVNLKIILFSNLSQTCINLAQYQNALSFSNKALELDSNHLKSLGRQAQSLKFLNDFEKSLKVYETINNSHKKDVSKEIKELKQLLQFQQNGCKQIDLLNFAADRDQQFKLSPYFGPIKIGFTENKGRGVFTTKEVKRGDVLALEQSLIEPEGDKNHLYSIGINSDKTTDIYSSVEFKIYLLHLIQESVIVRKRLSYLYKGEDFKQLKIPDLSIYKYDYYNPEDEEIILTAQDIQQIIKFNSTQLQVQNELGNDPITNRTMLNLFTSLINHSSKQNVSLTRCGRYCAVVAMIDIKEGEELCYDYLNLQNLDTQERKKSLLTWNIVE
ncbi:hypothetical protein ABPG72_015183 [Tetrahymena utriculariae]